jgi:hypothetical protein
MYNLTLFFNDYDRALHHLVVFDEMMSKNSDYLLETETSIVDKNVIQIEHKFINKQKWVDQSLDLN